MKNFKLAVLSLLALVFARPIGFSTANAASAADKAEDAALGKPNPDETIEQTVARLSAEVVALRAASAVPIAPAVPIVTGSTELLMKGAGVNVGDVAWRIRAGLSPAQAVEVALMEKNEAKRAKEAKK
jgi:hypothetical protein